MDNPSVKNQRFLTAPFAQGSQGRSRASAASNDFHRVTISSYPPMVLRQLQAVVTNLQPAMPANNNLSAGCVRSISILSNRPSIAENRVKCYGSPKETPGRSENLPGAVRFIQKKRLTPRSKPQRFALPAGRCCTPAGCWMPGSRRRSAPPLWPAGRGWFPCREYPWRCTRRWPDRWRR